MDLRIVILILLALAKATPERYYNEKSSYDEKSSYNVKSGGESENNYHDINCNLLRVQ